MQGVHDERLLQLAAAARMNTDTRRAVFCAVMGSEDATDAFERLLRLSLKARQLPLLILRLCHGYVIDVMGSEDAIDAFERLLRLSLKA